MSLRVIARVVVLLLVGVGGCSDSAVGPGDGNAPLGQYELDFAFNRELTLIATVRNANGDAAQGGSATFEYCSKGPPRDDITNPDETSVVACASGSGSWLYVGMVAVDSEGEARFNFGQVTVVRVIGFRFRYEGQGSGIASFTTPGEDWIRF